MSMGKITGDMVCAWWFDPETGDMQKIGIYENKGIMEFTPPTNKKSWTDYVLIITDSKKDYFG